jgi:predicted Fe-S protein YdhL (DUF1289 family)
VEVSIHKLHALIEVLSVPPTAYVADMSNVIESPCIRICAIDPELKLCTGCFRTLAEIGGWLSMTPAERRVVMDQLPRRRDDAAQQREMQS